MGIIARSGADGGLVTLTLDDGKLNALDADVFREIDEAFSKAADAPGVVLAGREGVFTAGLNTKKLPELDDDGLKELLTVFGQAVMHVWTHPAPVVAACTGHAIAAGTMLAMACDHAVAAEGDFRWGLTETQIGFSLPEFGIALARANVRSDRVDDLLLPGAVVGPDVAVEVGYADELAPAGEVLARAEERAHELSALPRSAYAATKQRLRGETAERVLAGLEADVAELVAARPG
ncbi:MAG: enoyl-CoA hydratase-related protein [Nitriliruptorales bacterium]